MDTWNALLQNPAGLLAVLCLAGVALATNLALIALVRGTKLDLSRWRQALNAEANIWQRSVTGGQSAQRQQADQLGELRQLVEQLQSPPPSPDPNDPPAKG